MDIKTILVHLADDAGHMARLNYAVALARRHAAHVVGLYVTSPVSMPASATGRAASHAYVATAIETSRERAAELETEVRARRLAEEISWEFRIDDGEHIDVLTQYSHYADLAIVGKCVDETDAIVLHRPDDLPLAAACPVVILPNVTDAPPIGGPVLLAWKPSREAARALHGALPLIAHADKVYVTAAPSKAQGHTPGVFIADYLVRHGADVEVLDVAPDGEEPGEIILRDAKNHGCGLVVMGAYGHSRLREFIFGGTTRYVLANLDRPVLMTH